MSCSKRHYGIRFMTVDINVTVVSLMFICRDINAFMTRGILYIRKSL